MQEERMVAFNQQQESSAVDVTFEWKGGIGYEGGFNTFYPEVLVNLNFKTPTLYELLWNSVVALPGKEDIFHTTKATGDLFPEVNILEEELPRAEEILTFLSKA
jgi:hypothetical protein